MDDDLHPIAREIRAARAYSGMSRRQLGTAIGVSDQTIGAWERGSFKRLPAPPMLAAIAQRTGLPVRFDYVTETPAGPSVAERARAAARRLDGTQGPSSGTDDVPGAEGGGA